ncbi:MAG: ABC transporter ATP-binding protein, partial [Anaerolineaceae bacterium]|nr:ABC transporter ATP-binding protein [Anaerolineaceae bacterium]
VGENGAGKTTLVKLLSRLYDPSQGQILLNGRDLREYDPEEYYRQVGVIFQDFTRYELTARENVGFGSIQAVDDLTQVRQAAEMGGALGLIEKLPGGFETMLGKRFENGDPTRKSVDLSGGEWQKIALARAFMGTVNRGNASLLILDEPTAALDAYAEAEVYSRFSELTQGKTTLFVTHRLSSVKIAHTILVLKQGRLIEEGNHAALLELKGEYAKMFSLQAERYQIHSTEDGI